MSDGSDRLYIGFEDRFRGSIDEVREKQRGVEPRERVVVPTVGLAARVLEELERFQPLTLERIEFVGAHAKIS